MVPFFRYSFSIFSGFFCMALAAGEVFAQKISLEQPTALYSVESPVIFDVATTLAINEFAMAAFDVTLNQPDNSYYEGRFYAWLTGKKPIARLGFSSEWFDLLGAHPVEGSQIQVTFTGSVWGAELQAGPVTQLTLPVASAVSAAVAAGSPWGASVSHTSGQSSFTWWLAPIWESGINWLRAFDQDSASDTDSRLTSVLNIGYQQAGILQWSSGDGFPDEDIPGWEHAVRTRLNNAAGRVPHWEVWNEPPNFSDDKNPTHYAAIVASAYDTVKQYDRELAVGLAAASVHLNFLDRALTAGAANNFDYITLHPYETLELVTKRGFEAQFMAIVPSVRKMLRARNPEKFNVPIIFTELGVDIKLSNESWQDIDVDEREQLQQSALVKAYVMSLAQGVSRIHWFEAVDVEDTTKGLLRGGRDNFTRRPSYYAIQSLIEKLGETPRFLGWLLLDNQHYGFVFRGQDSTPLLISWTAPGTTAPVSFTRAVTAIDPVSGSETTAKTHTLSPQPVFFTNVPIELVDSARANNGKPFPWNGDFSEATSVQFRPDAELGLHVTGSPVTVEMAGSLAINAGNASALAFTVDPNFVLYNSEPLRVTAEVRFNESDPNAKTPGFNLSYESFNGFTNHSAGWRSVSKDGQWHSISWDIAEQQFVGKWGYHLQLNSDSKQNSQYLLRRLTVTKK